ncbi:AsnC family transcriptional regulator [Amylibacter marinus]|uniref:AsnC family transcriptional regulator n=1 Tax=Amylibacter marinus TaxID=1475483 RepID=A0ABQ5VVE5_9RHOB|nr:Lrp/AsnC family transcriptional regulator [Amylibacter marinus]GLQ35181.1 AsnC family transcriptional regulator [Amylibacter marinus]
MIEVDAIDHKILDVIRADGRISILELSDKVGLSPTPCGRRVKRLENSGVIMGYGARINPKALGLNISVLISVRLARQGPNASRQFLDAIKLRPEITECMLMAGNIDYMLRIWVRDIDALAVFVRDELQSIPAVAETNTMVILKQDLQTP